MEYIHIRCDYNEIVTDFEKQYLFVIDTFSVYKYTVVDNRLAKVFDLDDIVDSNDIVMRMNEAVL